LNIDLQRQTVSARFSAAAETYAHRATVQARVAANLIRLIPPSDVVHRILEVGCGTGILTRYLLGHFQHATIDAVDFSPKMIAAASRQFQAAPTIHWHAADARLFRGATLYELVVSNCSLHWITPLLEVFYNLAGQIRPGGALTFSIMLHGTLGELHAARLCVAPHKAPAGRLPLLNEVSDCLDLCGLEIIESHAQVEIEVYAGAPDFFQAIHEMGLTGGAVSRAAVPLNRREIEQLMSHYEQAYATDGGVRASYNVGYFKTRRR